MTSKIAADVKNYDEAKAAIQASLSRLSLDYVDLLLISSPQPWDEVGHTDNHYFAGNIETWQAMTEAVSEGKAHSIGVANFGVTDLQNLMVNSNIKPAVNQIKIYLGHTPLNLINFCKENEILPVACSPLAGGRLLADSLIRKYAFKYGVSPSQLMLRYVLQLGAAVVVQSLNQRQMQEDRRLNFAISDEDMADLTELEL